MGNTQYKGVLIFNNAKYQSRIDLFHSNVHFKLSVFSQKTVAKDVVFSYLLLISLSITILGAV